MGGRIAQLLEDTAGTLGFAVDQQRGGFAQGCTAKIIVHTESLHTVKKCRYLDQFGSGRNECTVHHRLSCKRRPKSICLWVGSARHGPCKKRQDLKSAGQVKSTARVI